MSAPERAAHLGLMSTQPSERPRIRIVFEGETPDERWSHVFNVGTGMEPWGVIAAQPEVVTALHEAITAAYEALPEQAELALRALLGSGGCENSTTAIDACFTEGRTIDAMYGCDRACPACIAHRVLTGQDLVTGLGKEADRSLAHDYYLHRNHPKTHQWSDGVSQSYDAPTCGRYGCVRVKIQPATPEEQS